MRKLKHRTPDQMVREHILRHVKNVSVATKFPTGKAPNLFIRVDIGAPQRNNLIQYRTVTIIEVYGTDQIQVVDLAFDISELMEQIEVEDPDVSGWDETAGPVDHPDPDIQDTHFRWQLTGELYSTLA